MEILFNQVETTNSLLVKIMELLLIIAAVAGIIGGLIQLLDYLDKKRKQKTSTSSSVSNASEISVAQNDAKVIRKSKNSLSIPITPLIDRNNEVSAIKKLLRNGEVHLLTIVGLGGVGKTRLAMKVAYDLVEDFVDGVFFVSLAETNDHNLIIPLIAQALKIQEIGVETSTQQIVEYLENKRVLLVVDNFEQVLAAAPQLSKLLTQCPLLTILLTSRVSLRINGENEFPVLPLELPDGQIERSIQKLYEYPSIALFLERARAVKPDLSITNEKMQVIAAICTRLEGLPLAIELAAARIKSLPLPYIFEQLENRFSFLVGGSKDLPRRQQTLYSTLAWSYDLLTQWEQVLFVRLCVFVGGFSLDAAEAIVGQGRGESQIIDGIASLIDNSFLLCSETGNGNLRYYLLETIREFGLGVAANREFVQPGQSNSRKYVEIDLISQRHADYFLDLVEQAEKLLPGNAQLFWLNCLDQDYNNIRRALQWLIEHNEEEKSLRLVGALGLYWEIRGFYPEGQIWLEKVLTSSNRDFNEIRIKVLRVAAGILPFLSGQIVQGEELYEQSLALSRELGDKLEIALTLNYLGNLHARLGNYQEAEAMSDESLSLCSEIDYIPGIAWAKLNLGHTANYRGNKALASTFLNDSLYLFRSNGDQRGIASALDGLAIVAKYDGDFEEARLLWQESLTIYEQLGYRLRMAVILASLSEVELYQNKYQEAKIKADTANKLFEDISDLRGIGRTCLILGQIALSENEYESALELFDKALDLMVAWGDKKYTAKALIGKGEVLEKQKQYGKAMRCITLGKCILEKIGAVLTSTELTDIEHAQTTIKVELGEEKYATTWKQIYILSLEQTLEFASTE